MKKTFLAAMVLSLFLCSTLSAKTAQAQTAAANDVSFRADLLSNSGDVILPAEAAFAPETGWEVYGGYGYFSLNTIAMLIASAFGMIFTAPAASISDKEADYSFSDYGVFNLGADYYFGEHLFAGVTTTFQYFHALEMNVIFSSLMAEGGVQYGWNRFKFYHTLAAGLGLVTVGSHSPSALFAFNVTMLGMKCRITDGAWIYLESNAGQKAFFQGGARFKM